LNSSLLIASTTTLNNATINDYYGDIYSEPNGTGPAVLTFGSGLSIIVSGISTLADVGNAGDASSTTARSRSRRATLHHRNSFTNSGNITLSNLSELYISSFDFNNSTSGTIRSARTPH